MITSSGMRCDVCGIFNLDYEAWDFFRVPAAAGELHCCPTCKPILADAKRWEDLPGGPLRTLYQEATEATE